MVILLNKMVLIYYVDLYWELGSIYINVRYDCLFYGVFFSIVDRVLVFC